MISATGNHIRFGDAGFPASSWHQLEERLEKRNAPGPAVCWVAAQTFCPVRHVCVCLLASGLAPVCADAPIGKGGFNRGSQRRRHCRPEGARVVRAHVLWFLYFCFPCSRLTRLPTRKTHKAQGTRARGTRHQVPARHARISSRLALGGEGGPELLGLLAEDEGVSKRVEDRHLLGPLGRAVLEPRPHVAVALCCQRGVVLGKVGRGDAEPDARAAVAVVLAQV